MYLQYRRIQVELHEGKEVLATMKKEIEVQCSRNRTDRVDSGKILFRRYGKQEVIYLAVSRRPNPLYHDFLVMSNNLS